MAEYKLALAYTRNPVEAARAHNNLGVALSQLNQPGAAISEFGAAIQINPNEYNSFLGRGLIEYQSGHIEAARVDFFRSAQIVMSPMALYWLGRSFEDEGNLKDATGAYEAALKMAPTMEEAKIHLDAVHLKAQK